MKLAEAILERDALNTFLETLESRLRDEETSSRGRGHLIEEVQNVANQVRDLNIAIDWTENTNTLMNLPIRGQRRKIESNFKLAKILDDVDPERADALWRTAVDDRKVVEAATWLVDLQVPAAEGNAGEPHKEG